MPGQRQTDYIERFIAGYCEAMLWANTREVHDTEGTGDVSPADWQTPADGWQLRAFAPQSQVSITAGCTRFVRENWRDLAGTDYGSRGSQYGNAECAGHDFALTRNGHGAGFWDRGLGDVGDRLTEACRPYGESTAWFDDDEAGSPVHLDDERACEACIAAGTDCSH